MIERAVDHTSRLARGGLADEEAAARLAAQDPDEHVRRREFLLRTAAAAGGASLATMLPADALVAEAARKQGLRRLPRPREMPLETIVVLMMENRSFDHYFGWHPKADARNAGLSYPDINGVEHETHRLTPDFQGCDFRDPNHAWDGGRHQYNGGRNDGFFTGTKDGTGSDEFAIGYYLKEDLGFLPHAAKRYTLYDRWFTSIMASTYPNRHYQWGAQGGGMKENEFPRTTEGFTWETIFDRARSRGVSALYFNSDIPFSGQYGRRAIPFTRPISEYYERAASGTLPQICFVDPPFRDAAAGYGGTSADDHPHGDIRAGQAFMSDVAHAFLESPQYRRGVLFINYDEWGGFFDHVKPRFVPDDRRNRHDIFEDWGMTGFRVPGVAISPFTRNGGVNHMTVTHESILKLISYRFGLGHLNKRHRYASNIGRSFDFDRRDLEPPELPDPERIVSTPCAAGGESGFPFPGQRSARPKEHDLVALETSGYLERLGYEVRPATPDRIFRQPDRIARAMREWGG